MLDHLFRCTVTWLAPMLCFTAEEAWCARYRAADGSVHLELFPEVPASWRDDALAEKWRKVRLVRRVVTGALEIERAGKRIGSSLEADPIVHVSNPELFAALVDIDLAEICITSAATLVERRGPGRRLPAAGGARRRRRGQPRRGPQVRALVENLAHRRQRSAISRRDAARRPGAARMGNHAQGGGVDRADGGALAATSGARSPAFGLAAAAVAGALDQALKLWLLFVFGLAEPGRGRGRAVRRPGADLEHRHQLRLVPAGGPARAMGAARRSRSSRWRCCGSGWPAPAPG